MTSTKEKALDNALTLLCEKRIKKEEALTIIKGLVECDSIQVWSDRINPYTPITYTYSTDTNNNNNEGE